MSSNSKTVNPFEIVIEQIDAVCDRLGVDDIYRSRLKKCERELIVNFPVRMDDGTAKVSTGLNKGGRGLVAGISFGYKVPNRKRFLKSNSRGINLESAGG